MPCQLTYLLGRHPNPGETFIQREIDALRRRGWSLDVVSLAGASAIPACNRDKWPQEPPLPALAAATLRHALPLIFRLPLLPLQLLRRLPQTAALAQRLRATNASGIHAHFAHLPADMALLAARHAGVRFTCSVHAWDLFAQPAAATRRRLQPAAAVCACSQAAADAVRAAGIDPARIHLIHHGLPLAEYPFAWTPGNRRIVAVGRLEPKKGFDLLIHACARLRGESFACQIIGDGSQRAALGHLLRVAAAAADGRSLPVELTGPATPDEVRAAMRAADVLVLPSRRLPGNDRDGIANVLVEAMALGLPVVTTPAGAAGEVVRDRVNGRLVPPENPAALADAISALLNDPAARARLARAARATVEKDFNEEHTISQMEARVLRPQDARQLL